ncbi:uncharacterized protein LOC111058358 [Nilaparvata lugens]|uniref:uncharacterized protein LOC111058358 n=1 Tax=Nilaparvata lugens TaxID=108931 RepID=UPI00193D4C26|nr:uncharacterized protein LOC111058358 [Nilaparvata lugens]XP_039296806.1 uncharacterized protein LOC111058358 [Nilaparvata lugens]
MINDVALSRNRTVVCYADDTSLLDINGDLADLHELMQASEGTVADWFRANRFLLNSKKTQSIVFSLKNGDQFNFPSVKLLGFTMDRKLAWGDHIQGVCCRLNRVLFLLRSLRGCIPGAHHRMCYFAFFHSVMAYGITLWGGAAEVKRILLVQKKAIRILCGADYLANCKPLFVREHIMTVFNLYIYRSAIAAFRGLVALPTDFHRHDTRNRHRLNLPYCRLGRTQNSLAYQPVRILNKLPISARGLPEVVLRRRLRTFLHENPFYSLREFFECDTATNGVQEYSG